MDFLAALIMATVALIGIQGKKLDPGPQVFNDSLKLEPQSSQKRYATKEIILYLTPSQIRALQEGQGLISPQHVSQTENDKNSHGQASIAHHNYDERFHQHLAHLQPQKSPPPHLAPVEEPHSDHFIPIVPPPEYRQSDNYAYINFEPQNRPNDHKPVPFSPETHDQAILFRNKAITPLIPLEPLHDKTHDVHSFREHLKDQWYRLLDQNRAQLKALAALSQYNINKSTEHKKELLQYAPKYSDQKYALDVEHSVKNNHQQQLEHQHALLQAEAIANSPPVIVHKEINIKHSPVHLIKQVKVPVPTPVLIPIPEPFEVKVPQPYPVPLEIIKPIPVPIVNTQKIEVDRHVPVEIEKQIPFPVSKNVYINFEKPYFLERGIPVEVPLSKSGNLPIPSHVWKH